MTEETLYTSMKVKNMPVNPVPSVKLICSGGCGDMVWVDKRLERVWSKVPVYCLECALEKMDETDEEVTVSILPESIESLMQYYIKNRGKINEVP